MALSRKEAVVKNIPGVIGILNALPKETFALLKEAFQKDGTEWDGAMQDRMRSGQHLVVRSGRTRGSLFNGVQGRSLATLKFRAFSMGIPHALALERGAVIRPRTAKMLAIPGKDNLSPDGIRTHSSARDFIERHKKTVSFVRVKGSDRVLVVWRPRGENRKKKKERGKIMFVLVKKVIIPGPDTTGTVSKLGFFDTWDSLRTSRVARHAEALTKAVERVRRMKLSNIRKGKTKNVRTVKE